MDVFENYNLTIQRFKKENESLRNFVQSLKETHKKELETQAQIFHDLLHNENENMKRKLENANTKIMLLNRQKERRDMQINDLCKQETRTCWTIHLMKF